MAWPVLFNSLTNPQPLLDFDTQFNAVTATLSIPSIASGTNAISLSPIANVGALQAYQELCGARFRAVANSSGPVTASINGLAFLPVYKSDGVTQASAGDLVNGNQYAVHYSLALNAGLGGFFLESPSVPATGAATWLTPGGRLTLVSGQPVLTTSVNNTGNLYYAPYASPFVPIYNGTSIQNVQFTSSLADTVGLTMTLGGGTFNIGNVADVFVFLNVGVPTLAIKNWTNQTTRALGLAIFGGFQTNAGASTFQINGGGTISIPANQATYLGTIACNNGINGNCSFVFGSAASGGGASQHYIYNYYNQVEFLSQAQDNGASYTYTSSTVRQARASSGNQHTILQGTSERPVRCVYSSREVYVGNGAAIAGIGFNSITTTSTYKQSSNTSATANMVNQGTCELAVGYTGLSFFAALEASDNVNANTFDGASLNNFAAYFWA